MSLESISKLQPNRTFAIRGTDGFGAHAAIVNATADSAEVHGVFRDQADFTVLELHNADSQYEHPVIGQLPSFDFSNVVMTFDLQYNGLQPIGSNKSPWIDWPNLVLLFESGEPLQVGLFDRAHLQSGTFVAANATVPIQVKSGQTVCTSGDRLVLFVNNASFDFVAGGGEDAEGVASSIADKINAYPWLGFGSNSIVVMASTDGFGNLLITYARTGYVNISGTAVTATTTAGHYFQFFSGLKSGDTIKLNDGTTVVDYTLAGDPSSPTSLTLSTSYTGLVSTDAIYLAPYGGVDGNSLRIYLLERPANVGLTLPAHEFQLSGGTSYDAVWRVTINFSSPANIRSMWLTFAPKLSDDGSLYADTEWWAKITNITLTDPSSVLPLKCSGPGSARVGSHDRWVSYTGLWHEQLGNNNVYLGRAYNTAQTGATVTIKTICQFTHDLYLGTLLGKDCGVVSVSVDGDAATPLNCCVQSDGEFAARRVLRTGVTPGAHTTVITLSGPYTATSGQPWDISSTGQNFWFDFMECAVLSDIPEITQPYSHLSPALDYDTDQTYKQSPARLMRGLQRMGFTGDLNFYLGVFWWMQKKRDATAVFHAKQYTFDLFANGDVITLEFGTGVFIFDIAKSVTSLDTSLTIAQHFAYYINCASVSMQASFAPGSGTSAVLTITPRTPQYGDVVSLPSLKNHTSTGTIGDTGDINAGVMGNWVIDPAASDPLNYPTRKFLADMYAEAATVGLQCVTALSMELTYPPDDGTSANVWSARFADGTAVTTGTGISFNGIEILSTQCAPVSKFTAFQSAIFTEIANAQAAAGLTPWIQFGEFLWWFFSSKQNMPVGFAAFTTPISIGLADPHGFSTGDRIILSGVLGMTSANGTRPITVTDSTHFTIDGSVPNAAWVSGSGLVSGGSMAFYDLETAAAAVVALSRPLASFTCQDDDPTVNSSADANFLAARLKSHIDAIRTAVLAAQPTAKFEILYPDDVLHSVVQYNAAVPFPQGGRLNAAVSFPSAWGTKATSGFDRIKIEALSWGAQYRSLKLAKEAMALFTTMPNTWTPADLAYLVPWFNGGCPWPTEFLAAVSAQFSLVCLWAYDHLTLQSWPMPLPKQVERVGS